MTNSRDEKQAGFADSSATTLNVDVLAERDLASSARPSVCVIEDDDAIRQTVRMLLEDEGYQVIEAADGLSGYRLLRTAPVPLIAVVDHKLPRMDGCDLLELAAQDEELRARHAFIFVTASPRRAEEDCGESIEELGAPLVAKPFDIEQLLEPVAEAARRLSAQALDVREKPTM
ncbi:MAG TPA: response regulator [Ktedonobacterales bacterium]|jgi:CheY-like chemotaxis protein|nr:response regulator [Ktedonobacterales bacterium]